MCFLEELRYRTPFSPLRNQIPAKADQIWTEVYVKTNTCKDDACRIRFAQHGRVVFHQGTRNTTALPATLVKKGAKFQIGRTKAEILHHAKLTVKHLARVNRRTIRNSPVVKAILDPLT